MKKINWKRRGLLLGTLIALSLLMQVLSRQTAWFGEWYAVNIYPLWVNTVGRLFSVLPFSVGEFLIYGGILLVVIWLTVSVIRIRKGTYRYRKMGRDAGVFVLHGGVILILIFNLNCGVNYYRYPFSQEAGFEMKEYTKAELTKLCEWLTQEINREAQLIETDADGLCALPDDVKKEASASMRKLGDRYESLDGYYPLPKPILSSFVMSYEKLQGVYFLTVEANYNRDMPAYSIPSTMCHELSHLKGFMREDEANFIAYLACQESDSPEFRYSGDLLAYIYSTNALAKDDPEAYSEIRAKLCDTANRELVHHNEWWSKYDGLVAKTYDKFNDTYLKANSQSDGVKSYGRMVDLLLSYRADFGE
ncbi:DUF3810 domain-containing protein [Diplocloster modestus]|uniref:DUF3810 domain-containing protein n=1 Tax=Diplocloster modestus TaxID=2850322 RepID=A0ABS6K452_9FIRM|nr:DUF3810 domain-containing protein [Diplocloster modestus]MBU9725302.1 DUF3810 domain-containing protein [Diplocloster modestus]